MRRGQLTSTMRRSSPPSARPCPADGAAVGKPSVAQLHPPLAEVGVAAGGVEVAMDAEGGPTECGANGCACDANELVTSACRLSSGGASASPGCIRRTLVRVALPDDPWRVEIRQDSLGRHQGS